MTNPLSRDRSVPERPPGVHAQAATRVESDYIIRPAAVIPVQAARELVTWFQRNALENGGLWNVGASTGIWQRYDKSWNGPFGARGDSQLVGTIYVTYDMPRKHEVVVHRVQITDHGLMLGWTSTTLVDEVLAYVGLTIDTCPRDTSLPATRGKDPFQRPDARSRGGV